MTAIDDRIVSAKRAIRAASVEGIERRTAAFVNARAQSASDGGYRIVGHAAVFNSLSNDLGGFREIISPGAFASALRKGPDVRALFNHDPSLVLARTKNGSLSLGEDGSGLAYEAAVSPEMADTDIGRRMRVYLDECLVDQSSFAFRVASKGDSWAEDEQGNLIRTIRTLSALYDVSPVTYPAYPAADSGLASDQPASGPRSRNRARVERVERLLAQEERERTVQDDKAAGYRHERDSRDLRLRRHEMKEQTR